MAPANPANPFLFASLSLVCFFFFLIENKPFVSAIARKEYSELQHIHHHRVALSSFFPSSSCSSPPQGRSRKGSLEVVHKHGPCSKLKQHTSSSLKTPLTVPHGEILKQDIARVRAIHSKLREEQRQPREGDGRPTMSSETSDQKAASLPALSGELLGSGNYFVTVGLGTPARELSLIFDTGSDLTWTQCLPCNGSDSCYPQLEAIFDPSRSSSYSNIPCSSSQCSQLSSATGHEPKCSGSTKDCIYAITYGDESSSTGNFAKETLTVTPDHVVGNFLFGCGHDNEGLFHGTSGLIGLGRNPVSFIQQTSDMFHKIFSYCIPSTASEVGYLTFGGAPPSDNITYTPFFSISQGSSFYALDVTGISLAGESLKIPSSVFSPGVIIDSGTVITRLPPAAYGPLRDAFRKAMSRYPMADPVELLDTCYDLSGYKNVVVPKVTLSFGGGVNVELDVSGVVYVVSETQACLAFAAIEDERDIAILGNAQQRTIEVVYDVEGGKIGFRPASCSGSSKSFTGAANMVQICFIFFYILLFFFKF